MDITLDAMKRFAVFLVFVNHHSSGVTFGDACGIVQSTSENDAIECLKEIAIAKKPVFKEWSLSIKQALEI